MLESSNVVRGSTTEHNLSILEQKWASVYSKLQERKVFFTLYSHCVLLPWSLNKRLWLYYGAMFAPQAKLTEGLSLAKEFHSSVQELLTKMSKCEESTGLLPAPSFVLDTVCTQLRDHRVGPFIHVVFFRCICFRCRDTVHLVFPFMKCFYLYRHWWIRWMDTGRRRSQCRT